MKKKLVLLLIGVLGFGGCGTTFIPESYLNNMAASQFSEMKRQIPVSQNPEYNAMVQRIGNRIARVVGSRMPEASWEFVVFDDEALNAFAMPGGKVGIFTGLIELVDSDDELAAVVGHEIAHVLLEHSNQRMSAEILRGVGGLAAAYGTKDMEESDRNKILAAYGLGTQVGLMLPYSRSHETEADREGLFLAARAGYDPRAAISFWEKMSNSGGASPPEFLSTHPGHNTRISNLREWMPQALRIYRQNQR